MLRALVPPLNSQLIKLAETFDSLEYLVYAVPYSITKNGLESLTSQKVDFFGLDPGKMQVTTPEFMISMVPNAVKKTKAVKNLEEIIAMFTELLNEGYKSFIQDSLDPLTDEQYKIQVSIPDVVTKKSALSIIDDFLISNLKGLPENTEIKYTPKKTIEVKNNLVNISYENVGYEIRSEEKVIILSPPIPEDRPSAPTYEFKEGFQRYRKRCQGI